MRVKVFEKYSLIANKKRNESDKSIDDDFSFGSKNAVKENGESYDLRLLLPTILVFIYSLVLILFVDHIKVFIYVTLLFLIASLVAVFIEYIKNKSGYGIRGKSENGKVVFFICFVLFLCLVVSININISKNKYDRLRNTFAVQNTGVNKSNSAYLKNSIRSNNEGNFINSIGKYTGKRYKQTNFIQISNNLMHKAVQDAVQWNEKNKDNEITYKNIVSDTKLNVKNFSEGRNNFYKKNEGSFTAINYRKIHDKEVKIKQEKYVTHNNITTLKWKRNRKEKKQNLPPITRYADTGEKLSIEKLDKNKVFIGRVKQYLSKTTNGYKTVVTITHIRDSNQIYEVENFDALLILGTKSSDNQKENTIETNLKTYQLEKIYTPGTTIAFKGNIKIGDFYSQWVSIFVKNNEKIPSKTHRVKKYDRYDSSSSKNPNFGETVILSDAYIKKQYAPVKTSAVETISESNFIWKTAQKMRNKILYALDTSSQYQPLILGMSVGNTNYIPNSLIQKMKDTNTIHLMSVSGTHLCMITLFLNSILFFLAPKLRTIVIILAYIFLIFLIGPLVPIIRSILMGILAFSATMSGNQRKTTHIFSMIFLGFLIYNPLFAVDYSFLLSTFSTMSIILFVKPAIGFIQQKITVRESFLAPILVSVTAQIFTTPILLIYNSKISILGVVANFLITPLASIVTILGIMISIMPAFIGNFFYALASVITYIIYEIVIFLDSIPMSTLEWGKGKYEIITFIIMCSIPIFSYYLYSLMKKEYKIRLESHTENNKEYTKI
ncbi:ComEC/Rec2 family competence protein [Actinomyces sp. zg-332]|uniref:ComEC/Rec2 family competence protein n=1 Tax=Actinomyces sp. zg-332 TaxID=2708340 RepID=UPI0018C2A420|nr:ComEC/Rec2 family competence protein [Actinomyces sp. zg-332]QPK94391.1 ComEC/Rec2 family competence protein [Actinomyces sp. zg-332]